MKTDPSNHYILVLDTCNGNIFAANTRTGMYNPFDNWLPEWATKCLPEMWELYKLIFLEDES